MKPVVSVVMSVYNSEQYLPEAIESILKQTFRDFEFLIIDDFSPDSSLKIIIDYSNKDNRIKYFYNKENLGLTKNLNKLINISHGKFIARMDADDISTPDRFEKQLEFLRKNPGIMVLGSYVQEINSQYIINFPLNNEAAKKCIVKSSPLGHPTVMMRKEIFDKDLLYPEKYRTNQDLALWFEVLNKGYKIANLPEVLLYYRRTSDTYHKRHNKAFNEFQIFFKGIWKLYGLSINLVFPFLRFIIRFMPVAVIKIIYKSKLRIYLMKFIKTRDR